MAREYKWGQTPFPSKRGRTCQSARSIAKSRNFADRGRFATLACSALRAAIFDRMPRPPRLIFAGQYYHVLNRANRTRRDFSRRRRLRGIHAAHGESAGACELPHPRRVPHAQSRSPGGPPAADDDIARWMQWLFTTQSVTITRKYGTTGRLWQGRYKSFLIQDDHYLLTLLRYVERNALRAKLVSRAEEWRWGSLNWRVASVITHWR